MSKKPVNVSLGEETLFEIREIARALRADYDEEPSRSRVLRTAIYRLYRQLQDDGRIPREMT
jgi:hypothetical protein